MRKRLAALCAAFLLCGLTACGESAPAEDATATTLTTTTTTAPESPVRAPLRLVATSPFSDGIAFVRYLDAEGMEQSAAINTAGDILFTPVEGMEASYYQNGICVVGDCIYDKSGTLIASPELSGYDALITGNCGGYVLAKKLITVNDVEDLEVSTTTTTTTTTATTTTTTTATTTTTTAPEDTLPTAPTAPLIPSGMALSIGVLNNKGEWAHPLDTDHPIALAAAAAGATELHIDVVNADVVRVRVGTAEPQYYRFSDGTLAANYDHYQSFLQEEESGIYQVAADGSKKLIIKDVVSDYSFKDAFIGRTTEIGEDDEVITRIKLYDYTGKALADLTDYPSLDGKYYFVNDRLLILVDDGTGNRYLALLNKDGKPAIESVPLNLRDVLYAPDEAGFVVESHTADGVVSYRHYDYVGNVVDFTDVATFSGFSEGLAAVVLTDGTVCYINRMAEIVIQ